MKKTDILFKANYRYDFDRDMYVNRKARKAFSIEFVDDHPLREIMKRIDEHTNGNGWQFYFNTPPSDGIRRELERMLA
jgi:hypothetical protein